MLRFLVNNVEQLDLALEHVSQGDATNARFGLMLTDNVVEITLHQLAKDKKSELKSLAYLRDKEYKDAAALESALGQYFEPKIKFAKLLGKLSDEVGDSISIFHSFRNEVYHIGVRHEAVLPTLSIFYFKAACDFLGTYSPRYLSWGSDQDLPKRARKYFKGHKTFPGSTEQNQAACASLGKAVGYDAAMVADVLADHMGEVVEEQDTSIDMIATGGPRQTSRDEAVVDCQAWPLAFSEEGKKLTRDKDWEGGSIFDHVKWIGQNYPLQFRRDPIPAWRKRVESLRLEKKPHKALRKYRDFMDQTADVRAAFDEAHGQIDAYIDEQIERMRGN